MGSPPIDEKILSLIVKNLLISTGLNPNYLSNLTYSFLYYYILLLVDLSSLFDII